jgi:hypothetical protein
MESNPELVYHYTSFEALFSIVNGIKDDEATLFLTHAQYMNDINEVHIEIRKFFEDLPTNVRSGVSNFLPLDSLFDFFSFSILSFCKKGNQLNQWRVYCPEGGVSIGFDKSMLVADGLQECIYDKKIKKEIFEELSNKVNDEYYSSTSKDKSVIVRNAIFSYLHELSKFKNEHFKEEKEYRLVLIHNNNSALDNQKFRIRNNRIIPYVPKTFNINLIKEIFIGPCLNPLILKRDIETFCKQKGISPNIKVSEIPLRVAY